MARTTHISVVVPVYRSEDNLEALVRELDGALGEAGLSHELILVNDGSPDGSWAVVERLARAHPHVRGVNLLRNYGQHNALLCGIREARCDVIVTMDDDLQNPPDQVPLLLEALDDGADVVYGPPKNEKHSLFRRLASQVTKVVLRHAMGAETARSISAFRAFRTRVRDAFAGYSGPYVNLDVLLTWGARDFRTVRVRQDPRRSGTSNYTFRKLVLHTLNMVTGFSTLPLRLATMTGFLFTGMGFVLLVWVVGRYLLEGGSVPGFPFLASAIAIFSGAQLFALGIMGEYLSRMHYRLMDRPPYAVGQTLGARRAASDRDAARGAASRAPGHPAADRAHAAGQSVTGEELASEELAGEELAGEGPAGEDPASAVSREAAAPEPAQTRAPRAVERPTAEDAADDAVRRSDVGAAATRREAK